MSEKLKQKMGESLCLRKKDNKHSIKKWIQIATRNDLRINNCWQWIVPKIYSTQGILTCKLCGKISNLNHVRKHHKLDEKIYELTNLIRKNGILSLSEMEKKK